MEHAQPVRGHAKPHTLAVGHAALALPLREMAQRFHWTGHLDQPADHGTLKPLAVAQWPDDLGLPEAPSGFGPQTVPLQFATALHRQCSARMAAFSRSVASLAAQVREVLRADDMRAGSTDAPDRMAAALGFAGGVHLNASLLAQTVALRTGSKPLGGDRRKRLQAALDGLNAWLTDRPVAYIAHSGQLPQDPGLSGVAGIRAPDPLTSAMALFDEVVPSCVAVVRAMHAARLDLAGRHDQRQAALIERLDWHAFDADEWQSVPGVAAVLAAEAMPGDAWGRLAGLAASGRAVQVLVLQTPVRLGSGNPAMPQTGVGLLALGRRNTLLVATTVANPAHLSASLDKLASASRPSVAVIAQPMWQAESPWLQAVLDHRGRVTPCLSWDGAAGQRWASCYALDGNPAADQPAETVAISLPDADGTSRIVQDMLSPGHAALLDPTLRDQFLFLAGTTTDGALVEIGRWLQADRSTRQLTVPFVWAQDGAAQVGRAVMTTRLAEACLDQQSTWRALQEFAGIGSEHVRRAVEAARAQARAEAAAEQAALMARHQADLEQAGQAAATLALQTLANDLLSLDLLASADGVLVDVPELPAAAVLAVPAVATVAAAAEGAPQSADEDSSTTGQEAFIDTALCTSCNDCTNINALMFKYDKNKQAYLGDVAAGTFLQLVTAAEKCPAHCIHPGTPRPGDPTVTPALLARAAKLN